MASFEVQAPGARQAAMTASPQQAAFRGPGLRVLSRILLSLLVLFAVAARPAMAQSILRDAEPEALLQDMMDPLTLAAGLRPGPVPLPPLSQRKHQAPAPGTHDHHL